MANRFSPAVLPRAPYTDSGEARSRALRSAGGLASAIAGGIRARRRAEEEEALREAILTGQIPTGSLGPEEGFGATMNRAATARMSERKRERQPGASTRVSAYDPVSGTFNRPVFTPGFNPAEPHPMEPISGVAGLGPADRGLEQISLEETPRALHADEAVREYLVRHGNTSALVEDHLTRAEEGRKLARAMAALRAAGASPEDQALVRAGVIEGSDAVEHMRDEDVEMEEAANDMAAWRALNRLDPKSYPEYFPSGGEWAKEYAERTDDDRYLSTHITLEGIKAENRMKLEQYEQGQANYRAQLRERGRGAGAAAAFAPKGVPAPAYEEALIMADNGASKEQIRQALMGGRHGLSFAQANVAASEAMEEAEPEAEELTPAQVHQIAMGAVNQNTERGAFLADIANLPPDSQADLIKAYDDLNETEEE